jgi:hypothetical protein
MAKSIAVKPKKRGRPATGKDPLVGIRIQPDLIARIERWAVGNDVSRSEAIRRLVEKGLAQEPAGSGTIAPDDINSSDDE